MLTGLCSFRLKMLQKIVSPLSPNFLASVSSLGDSQGTTWQPHSYKPLSHMGVRAHPCRHPHPGVRWQVPLPAPPQSFPQLSQKAGGGFQGAFGDKNSSPTCYPSNQDPQLLIHRPQKSLPSLYKSVLSPPHPCLPAPHLSPSPFARGSHKERPPTVFSILGSTEDNAE